MRLKIAPEIQTVPHTVQLLNAVGYPLGETPKLKPWSTREVVEMVEAELTEEGKAIPEEPKKDVQIFPDSRVSVTLPHAH